MSHSTKDHSENGNADHQIPVPDVENPHANLELTEEELDEIYSRPYMNPNHAKFGCDPDSNKLREAEKAMIDAKTEKCQELIKQNSEIYDILQQAKNDPHVLTMTGGREVDVNSITNLLFSDQHFLNLLGELLSKRPATKKVEAFFATQVQAKIDSMILDAKIQGK